MLIFDSHVHIEKGIIDPQIVGFEGYDLTVERKNLICNFPHLLNDYLNYKSENDTVTYIFDFRSELEIEKVKKLLLEQKISALKVHSRIQKISKDEYAEVEYKLREIPSHVPVILDAWYYGSELEYNPQIEGLIYIIKKQPNRKFVVAHSGGYKIIEYFYHTRELDNIIYDLSLTPQYLSDSSLFVDFKKFIKWIAPYKLMFGSDYPYGSPKLQLEILESCKVDFEKVLNQTASEIYRG